MTGYNLAQLAGVKGADDRLPASQERELLKSMKKCIIGLIPIVFILVGCESCPHYNRTQVAGPNGAPVAAAAKKPYGSVKLYQDKSEVPGSYDVIAILSVTGDKNEEPKFITAFLYRAADIGADGVIFHRVGETVAAVPGPFFTTITTMQAAYRGEAIRLR